jgi:hypothetical protein
MVSERLTKVLIEGAAVRFSGIDGAKKALSPGERERTGRLVAGEGT